MKRLVSLCALLLVVACNQAIAEPVTEQVVTDLADTAQLVEIFSSVDNDAAQLILLLSPT